MSNKVCSAQAQRLLLLGLGLILSTSCERAFDDNSKASISFNNATKVSAQSGHELKLAIVEIKAKDGSAVQRRFWFDQENGTSTVPPSYDFEIPKGAERLVQVAAVYETTERGLLFAYADHTQTFTNSEETVSILLKGLNDPATTVESSIQGRVLATENAGPTGKIDIFYTPEGKPPIRLFTHDIIAGWFETLAFNSLSFTYKIRGGVTLFGGGVNSEGLKSKAEKWVQVTFPERVQNTEQEREERHLFGFFGPGATNKSLCTEAHGETALSIGTNSNGDVDLLANIDQSEALSESCLSTATANFRDYMIVDLKKLADNGARDGTTMKPPFRLIDSGGFLGIQLSDDNTSITFDWKALPGVAAALDGYDFWIRPSQEQNYLHDGPMEGVACSRLGLLGFKRYTQLSPTATSLTIATSIYNENSTAVLCPVKGTIPFTSALRAEGDQAGGGGGGSNSPYLRLEGLGGDGSTLLRGMCYSVHFATYGTGGGNTSPSHTMSEDLLITPNLSGSAHFYSTLANCEQQTSQISTGLGIAASLSQSDTYYVRFNPGPASMNLDFTVNSTADGIVYEHKQPYNFESAFINLFRFDGTGVIGLNDCQKMGLERYLPDSTPDNRNYLLAIPISATDSNGANIQVFDNSTDCGLNTNPVSSVEIQSSAYQTWFYVRGNGLVITTSTSSTDSLAPLFPSEYSPPAPVPIQ